MDRKSLKDIITKPTIKIIGFFLMINIVVIVGLTLLQTYDEIEDTASDFITQMNIVWDYVQENQDLLNYNEAGVYEYKGFHCAIVGVDIASRISLETDYYLEYITENARSNFNIAEPVHLTALAAFRSDETVTEYIQVHSNNAKFYFVYTVPIYIEESCLECHGEPAGEIDVTGYAKEGYELGDIYGAASVSIPIMPYIIDVLQNVLLEVVVFASLIGLITYILLYIVKNNITNPLATLENEVSKIQDGDFNIDLSQVDVQGELGVLAEQITSMASQLDLLYTDLEGQVEVRTEQLSDMNTTLQALNIQLADESKYKSEFLAMITHELRTPLVTIISYTDIINRKIDFKSIGLDNLITDIEQQSQVLLKLINDILEMSRIEAGKSSLQTEIIDCGEICCYVKGKIDPIAENKNIDFKLHIATNLPLIIADPEKFQQMIENLAFNAIKFTNDFGKIDFNVNYDDNINSVVINISDNGIGIDKKDIPFIYDKFFQVNSSDTRISNGSGLGLALVKNIVDMHGWEIELISQVGQGTEFIITIPVLNDEIGGE